MKNFITTNNDDNIVSKYFNKNNCNWSGWIMTIQNNKKSYNSITITMNSEKNRTIKRTQNFSVDMHTHIYIIFMIVYHRVCAGGERYINVSKYKKKVNFMKQGTQPRQASNYWYTKKKNNTFFPFFFHISYSQILQYMHQYSRCCRYKIFTLKKIWVTIDVIIQWHHAMFLGLSLCFRGFTIII